MILFHYLEHLCTNRQPNISAQIVDEYFGKRKRKFNENQENNTLGESKHVTGKKVIHWTANGQPSAVRLLSEIVYCVNHIGGINDTIRYLTVCEIRVPKSLG